MAVFYYRVAQGDNMKPEHLVAASKLVQPQLIRTPNTRFSFSANTRFSHSARNALKTPLDHPKPS